jgi:2-hydroxy-3-oxopropionate reductase
VNESGYFDRGDSADAADARRANSTADVAVLGLGHMGYAIAVQLVRRGVRVRCWTRSDRPAATSELDVKRNPADAIQGADIVLLSLTDAAAIEKVLFESKLVALLLPNTIVVDLGTTGPIAARAHEQMLAERGISYLDAPVSGGVLGAERGDLTLFVGGDPSTFARAAPLLSHLGRPHHVGPVGAGQTVKLVNQIIVAVTIGAVAEGLRFAEWNGLDPAKVTHALQGGFADSAVLRQHGQRMVNRDFTPGGPCRLQLKDLHLIRDMMGGDIARLRHLSASLDGFEQLVETGYREADHSAYFELYAEHSMAAKK